MKVVLFSFFAAGILFASSAFAGHGHDRSHRGCIEGQTEVVIEQGPMGDDDHLVTRTCQNGTFYPESLGRRVSHRSCREGQTEVFIEQGEFGDDDKLVSRTCHNGSFYPVKRSRVAHRSCREGQIETWLIDRNSDEGNLETYICRNGAFVRYY